MTNPWNDFELGSPAAPQTGVAAVSRIPGSMELWWIAPDGSVQGGYFYEGTNWGRYELAPAGSASITGGIAAVSRIPSSMELWYVGPNGSVTDHYWYDGGTWESFQLAPGWRRCPRGRAGRIPRFRRRTSSGR